MCNCGSRRSGFSVLVRSLSDVLTSHGGHAVTGAASWQRTSSRGLHGCDGGSHTQGSYKVPVIWNGAFLPSAAKYPAIIFSHGLGAIRTVYSAVCMEMASQGFLVAAVEHRDGSAAATYCCHAPTGQGTLDEDPAQEEWIPFQKLQPGTKEFHMRNHQLHQRANECVQVLQLLTDINSGTSVANILQPSLDLSILKDMIDLSKVAVMGHSFGAVTGLLALVNNSQFRCAVALDAWMFPLEHNLYPEVKKPVLFINTEKFQTATSITRMRRIGCNNYRTKIMTILGSVHQSQSDFTFLTGRIVSKVFKTRGTIDPGLGMDITNRSALAFLREHLGLQEGAPQCADFLDGFAGHVVLDDPFLQSSL
ncbi:platelet-activating factor acetylhydrolase 2, cytoplasmic isoform X2 [Ambystoma mexicanum]|uniref:platelet-activating factor acetylhydrolase 2, cytoplasmic isoform X2 n=1 Tax=Ambystoma mexicanum TaxID=8296 RepID=UPI0037E6FE92